MGSTSSVLCRGGFAQQAENKGLQGKVGSLDVGGGVSTAHAREAMESTDHLCLHAGHGHQGSAICLVGCCQDMQSLTSSKEVPGCLGRDRDVSGK